MQAILRQGLVDLGLDHIPELDEKLLVYLDLLQRWNKAYNLTAVREPEQMLVRHLFDSLAIVELFRGFTGTCLDVGTGAGLPGIPLALVFPERQFGLLDSNGKKTRFLFQVKTELGLDNITVHNNRVEAFEVDNKYGLVVSRAFASLDDMVTGCSHLLAKEGRFLAMKGVYPEQELAAMPASIELIAVHKLHVPGLDEQRHLVELKAQ